MSAKAAKHKAATQREAAPRSRIVSVRLPGDLSEQLDSYARTMIRGRGRSELIVQAIEDYLSWRIPQQAGVREGIAAAERGDLIDHDQVVAWIDRTRAGLRGRITKVNTQASIERKKLAARPRKHAR